MNAPWIARTRAGVAQFVAFLCVRSGQVDLPPTLASLLNEAIAPRFEALAAGDRAHLIDVATRLARQGASDELVTAGLLHDIGKARPGCVLGCSTGLPTSSCGDFGQASCEGWER